jgi:hypothetical protein
VRAVQSNGFGLALQAACTNGKTRSKEVHMVAPTMLRTFADVWCSKKQNTQQIFLRFTK